MLLLALALAPSLCRAEPPGGRFTPLRMEAETQTVFPAGTADDEPVAADMSAAPDSVPGYIPVKPSTAMYHSLALAGWGQFDNRKTWKAYMFITAEAVCIGGFAYLQYKLNDDTLSAFDRERFRTDRNSFILYWMIAKVYGLMDAYVDAHLASYDVSDITPEELAR